MYTNSRRVQRSTSERDTRNESAQLLLVPATGAGIRETSVCAHEKPELSEVSDIRNSRGIITRVTDLSISLVKIILLCGRATGFFPPAVVYAYFPSADSRPKKGHKETAACPLAPQQGLRVPLVSRCFSFPSIETETAGNAARSQSNE